MPSFIPRTGKHFKGGRWEHAKNHMGLSKDKVLYKIIKEVAIKTNTSVEVTEYLVAYYFWYLYYIMTGPNFPKIQIPFFGTFYPSLKNVRLSIKLLIKSYKHGRTGREEFVKTFRYHWMVYKLIMDRTYGKYRIWKPIKKKKMNEYRIALINNPKRVELIKMAKENPEYFDDLRAKVLEDNRNKIITDLDTMREILKNARNNTVSQDNE